MTILVKDIQDLQKENPDARLKLYYAPAELMPEGLMLASVNQVAQSQESGVGSRESGQHQTALSRLMPLVKKANK